MPKKPQSIRDLEAELKVEIIEEPFKRFTATRPSNDARYAQDHRGHILALSFLSVKLPDCTIFSRFPHLQILIAINAVLKSITPLAALSRLTLLDLDHNQIQDCTPLAALSGLTLLDLGHNQIQDCTPLAALSGLTLLHLSHNQIQDCTPLAALSGLTRLYLSRNQIQDCTPLAALSGLTLLRLNGNQIQDCTPLAALPSLDRLRLANNRIEDISPLLPLVDSGLSFKWEYIANGITLKGNPLQRPPLEIAARGHEAIMAWFAAQVEPQRQLNEAKVLLVGAGGAGKTSLVRALCKQGFDPNQSQTHGIVVAPWLCSCDEREVLVHLWDFGGQEIMHATHQFFLSRRSLYLLVLDGRKEDGLEDYWLKLIESFGGDSPILVVLTKADENRSFDLDRLSLQRRYPNIIGFQRVSNKDGDGITELSQRLITALAKLDMVESSWPESWFQVKQALASMSEDFINYKRYQSICKEQGLEDKTQQKVLLDYLHDLGVALHYPDLEWLDTQVLKPNWVTTPIYQLINHPELASAYGELELSRLPALVPNFPSDRMAFLEKLMAKFEICHPIGAKSLLLPDLLNVAEPENLPFPSDELLHFSVRYHFLPRSILPRLMVRLYPDIHSEPANGVRYQWRNGVLFHHQTLQSQALVRANYETRRLDFQFAGPGRRAYLAVILATLRDIHRNFQKIGAEELIRCICGDCKTADAQEFSDKDITRLRSRGINTIQCFKSGEQVAISQLLVTTYGEPKPDRHQLLELLTPLAAQALNQNAFQTLAERILAMAAPQQNHDDLLKQAWAERKPKAKSKPAIPRSEKPSKLCWLHLSDLHYTSKQAWDSDRVLKQLQEDAKSYLKEIKQSPQLLFATGDLGYGEGVTKQPLQEQIQATLRYLKQLTNELEIPTENIFVIPGNHDVNRKKVLRGDRTLIAALNPGEADDLKFVNHMLASQNSEHESERDPDWPRLQARLADYYQACNAVLPKLYDLNPKQGIYHHLREFNGMKLGIFGMNGAWSCGPDEARGNLWLAANWQLTQAAKHLSQAQLRFGLLHHPPDWYIEEERRVLKQRLDQTFHILLHGHEHDPWVDSGNNHLRIAAGASFAETSAEFGYNIGVLDPTTGKGQIHLRTYSRIGWVLQPIPNRADKGVWSFQLQADK